MCWGWGARSSSTATLPHSGTPKTSRKYICWVKAIGNPYTYTYAMNLSHSLWKMQFLAESWTCRGVKSYLLGAVRANHPIGKKTYPIISTLFRVIKAWQKHDRQNWQKIYSILAESRDNSIEVRKSSRLLCVCATMYDQAYFWGTSKSVMETMWPSSGVVQWRCDLGKSSDSW